MEIRQALNTLAHDPYFCQGPDAGPAMGGLHITHKLPPQALSELARIPRDDLCMRLRAHLQRSHPDMPPEEMRRRADATQQSLETAMLRQIDEQLGQETAKALKNVAAEFRMLADRTDLCIERLWDCRCLPTRERQAVLESLLGDEALAKGLNLRLQHNSLHLLRQLVEGRRVALPQSTVDLTEIQQAMARTARQLDGLAARLSRPASDQGLTCLELCPDLTRGLLSSLPRDACLAMALDERQQFHHSCKAWDQGAHLLGSLLLDLGALAGMPLLAGASLANNLLGSAQQADAAARETRLRLLGALTATPSPANLHRLIQARSRNQAQALFSASITKIPGNSLWSALLYEADRPSVETQPGL